MINIYPAEEKSQHHLNGLMCSCKPSHEFIFHDLALVHNEFDDANKSKKTRLWKMSDSATVENLNIYEEDLFRNWKKYAVGFTLRHIRAWTFWTLRGANKIFDKTKKTVPWENISLYKKTKRGFKIIRQYNACGEKDISIEEKKC